MPAEALVNMVWITIACLSIAILGVILWRGVREILSLKSLTEGIAMSLGSRNPPSGMLGRQREIEERLGALEDRWRAVQQELGRMRGHMRASDLGESKPILTPEHIEQLREEFKAKQQQAKGETMSTKPATDEGFTLIELLIVIAIIGVIAAIAIPGLLRARMAGNEASAIGSLRAIISGQAIYSSTCAGGGYAVDLADLVKPAPSGTAGFISPDLGTNGVVKSGYAVTLAADAAPGTTTIGTAATTCNGSAAAPVSSYYASAEPVTPGSTGNRYFATDARSTVFFSQTGPVPNPIPAGALPVQ